MSDLTLLELYPGHLMMNGDMGNAAVLKRRAELAGLSLDIVGHEPGQPLTAQPELVSIGTGPNSAQAVVAGDIARIGPQLRAWAEAGVPMIAVNAGFHLLGRSLTLPDGELLEGAGVFATTTQPRRDRTITDAFVVDTELAGRVVGVENQAVQVTLHDQRPLGRVVTGRGDDGTVEGAVSGNAIGTHLHGPVLALNPALADHLLARAAARVGLSYRPGAAHAEIDDVARQAREHLVRAVGVPVDAPA